MSDTGPARPRQVTVVAYTIMAGSAFVVLFVFETLTSLNSLQTREAVESFLAEPPGNGLGMTVEGALSVMRVLGMVAAGCATAAGILGFQVLRRNKAARIGLTVLAVPLLVSGTVTGGFLSSLVAACAFLLWLPPARDWFEGREPPRAAERPVPPPAPERRTPLPAPPAAEPRSMTMWGAAPPGATPPRPGEGAPRSRPSPVVWACVLTWVGAGLGVLAMTGALVYLALDPERLLADLRAENPELVDAGLSDRAILAATFVTGAALVLWGLAAMALAVLLFRGVSWSRLLLVISTAVAMAVLALGVLTSVVVMVPFLASALTMTFLLRPETRDWAAPPR